LRLQSIVNELKSIINTIQLILQGKRKQANCLESTKAAFTNAIEAIRGPRFRTEIDKQIYKLEYHLRRLPVRQPWNEKFMVPNPKPPLEDISQRNLFDYLMIHYPKLLKRPRLTEHLMATILQRRREIVAKIQPHNPSLDAIVALYAPHRPAIPSAESQHQPDGDKLCPFCGATFRGMLLVGDWGKHVLTHTAAYSCRFQPCKTTDQWTIASLEHHDMEEHSRFDWDDVTSAGPAIRLECPFCDFKDNPRYWEENCVSRHSVFYDHLGRHLTSLTLDCLPVLKHWPILKPGEEATKVDSDSSDDSSKMSDSDRQSLKSSYAPSVSTMATTISNVPSSIRRPGSSGTTSSGRESLMRSPGHRPGSSGTTSSGRESLMRNSSLVHRPRRFSTVGAGARGSTIEVVEEDEDLQPESSTDRPYTKAFCDYFLLKGPKFNIVRELLRVPNDY